MNDVHVITVKKSRKYGGLYVFDDITKGLIKEPFVTDASAVIDDLKKMKKIKGNSITIMFSKSYIPRCDETLVLVKKHRDRYAVKNLVTGKYDIKEYVKGKYVSGTYVTTTGKSLWL